MQIPHASMEVLAAIRAVAESKDRDKAAESLGISVSALHKRLKALSQLLGADVIRSVGDGVELTEAGEIYRRDAERALDSAVLAEERAKAHLLLEERKLVIGHSTYLPGKMLETVLDIQFSEEEHVSIEHRTGLTADIAERVASGRLHAGFGFLPVEIEGLNERVLFEEPIVVCLASGHRLAAHRTIRAEELADEPVISVGREPMPSLHDEVANYFQEFSLDLNVVEDAFSPVEALRMVEQNRGLCFLAASSVVESRGVVTQPLSTKGLTRKSGLFLRGDQDHPLVLRFAEMALRQPRG